MQVVVGMKDLFLGLILSRHELDIVHQPNAHIALRSAEGIDSATLQGMHEFLRKLLSGNIAKWKAGVLGQDILSDRMQEVGLAKAALAINEEWIIFDSRIGRDRL